MVRFIGRRRRSCRDKKKLQVQFFLSYLLVLTVPLSIGSVVYYKSYSLVEKKELETRSLLVNECMVDMNNTIKKIDDFLIDLSRNSDLMKVMQMKQPSDGSPGVTLLYDLNRELSAEAVSSGLGKDFYISLNRPDLVFRGNSIVYGTKKFYDLAVSYKNIGYDDFRDRILDSYHFKSVVGNVEIEERQTANPALFTDKKGILYINSLPLVGSHAQILGTAVVHISGSITDELNAVPISDYGCTYVADQDRNVLAGVFGKQYKDSGEKLDFPQKKGTFYQTVGGRHMLVVYARSDYNGWYYVSMSPMDKIMGDLRNLRTLIFVITALIVLVGTFVAFLLSWRNSRPFEQALLELQEKRGSEPVRGNVFSGISREISRIIDDNEELNKTLNRQNTMMKISFFDRLLHGKFSGDGELEVMMRYLGLDLSGSLYGALVLSFGEQAADMDEEALFEHDILQIFMEKISLKQLKFRAYPHTLSIDRMCVLVCFDNVGENECRGIVEQELVQLAEAAHAKFSADIRCGVGNFYPDLNDVYLSFGEACTAADCLAAGGNGTAVLSYGEINKKKLSYFYPGEIEVKLRNLVSVGDGEQIRKVLDYVYEENFNNRRLTQYMVQYLITDMQTGLIKISEELKLGGKIFSEMKIGRECADAESDFRRIRELYGKLAELAGKPRAKGSSLIQQITAYIEKNCCDGDMSVAMMAEAFHISESYFSQYFKNNTGQIFSKYLESLRMEKACGFLKNTAMNIDEIAAAVGYRNTLSFRRAFKKIMGIPPSYYR